jgi:signal transduction histidine kinase
VTVSSQRSGVEIIVVDSGMGIRRADLATVFDEFQQLDYPSKYKPSGFGLGLAIVAGAVETIGACLVVSSRRGVGTAFTLWAPRLEA